MTTVTVNNSPIQDYLDPDDHTQPTYKMTLKFNLSQIKFSCIMLIFTLPQSSGLSQKLGFATVRTHDSKVG